MVREWKEEGEERERERKGKGNIVSSRQDKAMQGEERKGKERGERGSDEENGWNIRV